MQKEKTGFILGKKNGVLLAAGLLTIILGFVLMSGGAAENPDVFNEDEIFSTRRITIAPIVVLLGFTIVGWGIMVKPDKPIADSSEN